MVRSGLDLPAPDLTQDSQRRQVLPALQRVLDDADHPFALVAGQRQARRALGHWLRAELPVREAFAAVYDAALSLYLSGDGEARGCFLIGTAAVEAVDGPDIRAALKEGLDEVDAAFRGRLVLARQKGELPADSDPEALALLASATLYSLAVRARAGYARPVLDSVVRAGLDAIAPVRPGTAPTASADSAHPG